MPNGAEKCIESQSHFPINYKMLHIPIMKFTGWEREKKNTHAFAVMWSFSFWTFPPVWPHLSFETARYLWKRRVIHVEATNNYSKVDVCLFVNETLFFLNSSINESHRELIISTIRIREIFSFFVICSLCHYYTPQSHAKLSPIH